MTPSNMTPSSSSTQRRDNAAQRVHKRLGIWPWDIFTLPSRMSSTTSNASTVSHRPDLYPPANIGWSIQTLEYLSALAERFDQDQTQVPPCPSDRDSTTQQQAEAVEKSLLGSRVSQALVTAVEMRIKRQTRTAKTGAAAVIHTPKRPYLTCRDIKAVLADHKAKDKISSHTS
ncbi:hypothetical protein Daus18300_009359 [Diaporthe australafricana]|uniref:Uncharacterized protein n=1 Tax=Diaporthe australafricana TaxID=127596 RepID=A0ABR3WEP9_9PEZI